MELGNNMLLLPSFQVIMFSGSQAPTFWPFRWALCCPRLLLQDRAQVPYEQNVAINPGSSIVVEHLNSTRQESEWPDFSLGLQS